MMPVQDYVIELLEDLHSGDGLGKSDTDDTIARDHNKVPELRWTHLKGVLRANAQALVQRGLMEPKLVVEMFGWDSDEANASPSKGRIVGGSAKAVGSVSTRRRTTTALVPTARVPLNETRRTKEWLPAGSKLSWTCQVPEDLMSAWCQVLDVTRALGALRTRGAGRVSIVASAVLSSASHVQHSPSRPAVTSRLRLIVRAIEPLCFPIGGQVGNILQTEQYLPGSAVRGALIQACLNGGWGAGAEGWALAEVADCVTFIGNGYPAAATDGWQEETVVPAWAHLRQAKLRALHADLPHWVADGAEVHEADSGSRMTGAWFVAWNKHGIPELRRAQTVHHQRIRAQARGDASKQSLFATTSLASETRWVSDLKFPDEASAQAFAEQVLKPMMTSGLIRLGRGSRPAQVEAAEWLDDHPSGHFEDGSWSLLLASDLILRGPNLGYLTDIRSPYTLQRLLGTSLYQELEACGHLSSSRLLGGGGVQMVRGFNASTRMPRPFACAMAKGSALTFSHLEGRLALAVAQQLNSRRAYGERQHEGFGRVLWVKDLPKQVAHRQQSREDSDVNVGVAALRGASAKVESLAKQWASSRDASPLTRRQTGALLELARREPEASYAKALRTLLTEFRSLAAASSHSQDQLDNALMQGEEPAFSRMELELLCRWLLVLTGDA